MELEIKFKTSFLRKTHEASLGCSPGFHIYRPSLCARTWRCLSSKRCLCLSSIDAHRESQRQVLMSPPLMGDRETKCKKFASASKWQDSQALNSWPSFAMTSQTTYLRHRWEGRIREDLELGSLTGANSEDKRLKSYHCAHLWSTGTLIPLVISLCLPRTL